VKKRLFCALVLLLLSVSGLSAQQQRGTRPYWFILEEGKFAFRSGNYGEALIAFEEAKRERRSKYEYMEQAMIDLLSIYEVRRMEDNLEKIEQYIDERHHVDAADALAELYYRVPKDVLEGSAEKALEELGRLKAYPEAEYWIGEVYRIEGELNIALIQYQRAYDQRKFLENTGFEIEILYKMLDIFKIQQNYSNLEAKAQDILALDTRWAGDEGLRTRNAMMRILENEGINRFLIVYRHNNFVVERVHRLLGLYYYAIERYDRAAEHLMFSVLIQNTLLIEEMLLNQYDFSFTTLHDLLASLSRRRDLIEYMDDVDYYKTMYYFGAALFSAGKTALAQKLWSFLTTRPESGEWSGRARNQLRRPFVEKVQDIVVD
jgi:tetratricopeptide (TPR) repeat protein